MTEKKPPGQLTELEKRAQRLAGLLVKAANDPEADRWREAAEAEQEKRQVLILDAYHAARKPAEPAVGTALRDAAALRRHLQASGHEVTLHHEGMRIAADPPVDIRWAAERGQVRFTIRPAIKIASNRRAELDAAIARGNALTGLPVWRAEPEPIAEASAPTAADGSVSSAEVDRAIKILRTTVARDEAELMVLGSDRGAAVYAILARLDGLQRLRFKQAVVERAIRLIAPALPSKEADNGEWGGTGVATRWLLDPTEENARNAGAYTAADCMDGGVRYDDYSVVFHGPAEVAAAESAEEAARIALRFAVEVAQYRRNRGHGAPTTLPDPELAAAAAALAFQLALARQIS